MRILISGSHSLGKSTIVADFVQTYSNYIHEEEPYRVLRRFHNIQFAKKATCFCNSLQMYYAISRLQQYRSSKDCVIFDRAPVDYLPYSMYPALYGESDITDAYVENLVEPIRESLCFADLVVFVPITNKHIVELEDDGIRPIDIEYRKSVDTFFKQIYREQLYDIMPKVNPPRLIELWGDRQARVTKLANVIAEMQL